MNKQLFYRVSIIEKLIDISSFALVKNKAWIGALAYFKLMTNGILLPLFRLRFSSRENGRLVLSQCQFDTKQNNFSSTSSILNVADPKFRICNHTVFSPLPLYKIKADKVTDIDSDKSRETVFIAHIDRSKFRNTMEMDVSGDRAVRSHK